MIQKLLLINNLQLPNELNNIIKISYKYKMLESKYKSQYNKVISHMQYYLWLNKKLNKKDNLNVSIIKTIKEFDYY
jgi:formylmethanofuran dehydrogenase subunit E-like metal-binding protein